MISSHFYLPKLPCFYPLYLLKSVCITFNITFYVLKKKYSLSHTRQGIIKKDVFNGVFVILHLLLVSTSCSSLIVSSSLRRVTSSAPLRSWLNATHTNITVHHTAPAKNTDTKISVWQKLKTNTLKCHNITMKVWGSVVVTIMHWCNINNHNYTVSEKKPTVVFVFFFCLRVGPPWA